MSTQAEAVTAPIGHAPLINFNGAIGAIVAIDVDIPVNKNIQLRVRAIDDEGVRLEARTVHSALEIKHFGGVDFIPQLADRLKIKIDTSYSQYVKIHRGQTLATPWVNCSATTDSIYDWTNSNLIASSTALSYKYDYSSYGDYTSDGTTANRYWIPIPDANPLQIAARQRQMVLSAARQAMRDKMRSTNIIVKKPKMVPIYFQHEATPAEQRARALLRDMIGTEAYMNYMKRGFITTKGRSGTIYRISGGHNRVVSYVKWPSGKLEEHEAFCIVFKTANLPFTDGVIMRKLIVEHDEFSLRKMSNVSNVQRGSSNIYMGGQNLVLVA